MFLREIFTHNDPDLLDRGARCCLYLGDQVNKGESKPVFRYLESLVVCAYKAYPLVVGLNIDEELTQCNHDNRRA